MSSFFLVGSMATMVDAVEVDDEFAEADIFCAARFDGSRASRGEGDVDVATVIVEGEEGMKLD
jgi:hypothetical protein